MTAILRRKRLADGSFGELEKVFDGETAEEVIARLEEENAKMAGAQAILLFQLLEKGVL